MIVGGAAAEEFVRVDGPEVPYAHLHLPFGAYPEGPYGLGLRVAFGLVKYQGLDVLLFLAVVGGIYEASGAFDDVTYGIVEGVGGVKVLVGKVQKFGIHSSLFYRDILPLYFASVGEDVVTGRYVLHLKALKGFIANTLVIGCLSGVIVAGEDNINA